MARQIAQYRYYNAADVEGRNQPKDIAYNNLVSGSIFSKTMPIIQLGIQALPGTKFYLNNSVDPIIIGTTGIYELDLEGKSEITALSFAGSSIRNIVNNVNGYLIVDCVYEDGKENS
jgi:hypothetical protein